MLTYFNNNYNLKEKIFFLSKNLFTKSIYKKINNFLKKKKLYNFFLKNFNFNLKKNKIKIVYVPHHLAHIASTTFTFNIKNGLAFSFDGSGDFSTTEVYKIKNEQYNLIEKISEGSFGSVFKAENIRTKENVAIKFEIKMGIHIFVLNV
jgi:predicted NodU family carbamoyl transferase